MTARIHLQHTVFSLVITAAAVASLLLPLPFAARAILTAFFFLGTGFVAGQGLFADEPRFWRTFLGTVCTLALTMATGSATYFLYKLDASSVALVLFIDVFAAAACCSWTLQRRKKVFQATTPPSSAESSAASAKPKLRSEPIVRAILGTLLTGVAVALVVYGFSILTGAATGTSIRSPWDVVPRMFFIVFFFAAVATLAAASGGLSPRVSLLAGSGLAVLATGVAMTVYTVGFGFDPFIHRATEATIFRDGFITPKPPYYLGQYALVTIIARLLGGGVSAIDAWLVPAAFALLIPCAYWSLRKAFGFGPSACAAAALSLLILPLDSFAATTPQGVANVVFLMTAFLALPTVTKGAFPRLALFLLASAAASIHPIAGIPLLVFATLVTLLSWYERRKGVFRKAALSVVILGVTLAGAVALPATFYVSSLHSGAGVTLDTDTLRSPTSLIETLQAAPVITRQFSALYDFVYSWKAWRDAALVLLAVLGLYVSRRRTRTGFVYLISGLVLASNYVLLKSVVQFPFLIAYERSNYANRLWELTLFVIAPMAVTAVAAIFSRAGRHVPTVRVMAALLLASLVTSSVYLAYPRRDKYENSRGWSSNSFDVEAVRGIEKDAGGAPYVVLANQSVSAAAVREFGFPRYYASKDAGRPAPIFYYPIPTGDPLYQIFLDTNAALGKRDAVTKAMDLAGVDTAYYVVSYYWWHAQEILLTAKKNADASWSVGDKDYVFKYVRKK